MYTKKSRSVQGAVFGILGIIAFTAVSCATMGTVQTEDDVRAVVNLVTADEAEILVRQSKVPFLFDGEILGRTRDVGDMWRLVAASGLFGGELLVASIYDAGPDTYQIFSDSKQVRLFFEKYLTEYARVAVIEVPAATVLMLLDGKADGYSLITGMKVELK